MLLEHMPKTLRQPGRLAPGWSGWVLCLLLFFPAVSLPAATASDSGPSAPEIRTSVHSPKKGLGIGTTGRYPDWEQRLNRLHVAWFYTWRAQHPGKVSGNVEFVPMVWGRNGINDETLADLVRGQREGLYRNLLGFNEPDARKQANMPADEAVKLWSSLLATGLRLGSPATLNPHNPWMREFVSSVEKQGERLDFIAMHWYGGPHPEKFLLHLEYVHKRYRRPIWITEFAVADWKARENGTSRISPEQALSFMKTVIPALERLDYIERYAWFPAAPDHPALGQSALFNVDGTLTPLGRLYAGY